jgi:hypothetical protein
MCSIEEEAKVEQRSILTTQPINHYVNRRHHSLVVSPIDLRIMVCWCTYLLSRNNLHNQCGITHKRRGDVIVIEAIPRHHKIGISNYCFTHAQDRHM